MREGERRGGREGEGEKRGVRERGREKGEVEVREGGRGCSGPCS